MDESKDIDNRSSTNSLERLIQNVATRAEISDTTAEYVVDMVLSEVKTKLPPSMAAELVAVMSSDRGFAQTEQDSTEEAKRFDTDRIGDVLGDVGENLGRVGEQVLDDAGRLGGRALEEANRVRGKVIEDATDTAEKLSRWAKDLVDGQKK